MTTTVMCAGCKNPIEVPAPLPPKIVNLASFSMVIVEHAEQGYCAHCNAAVAVSVAGAQLGLAALPVPAQEQQPIILAPNGMKVIH